MNKIITLACFCFVGCTSVYTPKAPLKEMDYYSDYGATASGVYPSAFNTFVDSYILVKEQAFNLENSRGVAITYSTNVTTEVFDKLLVAFADLKPDQVKDFCRTTGGGSSSITLFFDGVETTIHPIQIAVYPIDTNNTKGRYDLIGFNPEVCDGGPVRWVYIDTIKTRNFPIPLYSPDMIHVFRNGKFYTELTPGFIPGVNTDNQVEAYGLFIAVGQHEITAFYPDATPDNAHHVYTAKKESYQFK